MLTRQADDVLSTGVLSVIGALRTYAARMQFFLGVPNTLMIAVLFYGDAPLIQSYIPTVYHWVALILFGVVPTAVLLDRMLLHPAQIIYNQHQNGHESRSPNYRETMTNQREIQRLHEKLDRLEMTAETTTDTDENHNNRNRQ
jgi:hypothetical protein